MRLLSAVVTYFRHIHGEMLAYGFEFPFVLEEFDQLVGIHVFSRTSVETLVFPKLSDNGFFQRSFRILVAFHHVEDFMCM